jgi:hypothetical protein
MSRESAGDRHQVRLQRLRQVSKPVSVFVSAKNFRLSRPSVLMDQNAFLFGMTFVLVRSAVYG